MKTLLVLPALGLLFFTACHTAYKSSPPDEITVELRGTPGLNVCGNYYIDGVKQTLHGQIPMDIKAIARSFQGDFNKTGTGDLNLVLNHGCKSYGKVAAVTENGGVKAEFKDGNTMVMSSMSGY